MGLRDFKENTNATIVILLPFQLVSLPPFCCCHGVVVHTCVPVSPTLAVTGGVFLGSVLDSPEGPACAAASQVQFRQVELQWLCPEP